MSQEQKQTRKSPQDDEQSAITPESDVAERREALDEDVDAILDEIDSVLESNAEEFVRSFVQKGGQ